MAGQGSAHISQVLNNYKMEAMRSLHGPAAQEMLESARAKSYSDDLYRSKFKKAMLYLDPSRNKSKRDPLANSAGTSLSAKTPAESGIQSCHFNVPYNISRIVTSDGDNVKIETRDVQTTEPRVGICVSANAKSRDSSANVENGDSNVRRDTSQEDPSKANNNVQSWNEPRPYAPNYNAHPWPVLASADLDVLLGPAETFLDAEPIACFNIGGEPRLCFPQVITKILQDIPVYQIHGVCDNLHIYLKRCSLPQLQHLKKIGILPPTVTNCGLITKTDAQRLIHALLYAQINRPSPKLSNGKLSSIPRIMVYHNTFGKGKGCLWPELYDSPSACCIECLDCSNMYSPQQFVCHTHKSTDQCTCHWGFDAENWRRYLMLSKVQTIDEEKAREGLNQFKEKFDWNGSANHKRKQIEEDCKEDLKKIKQDNVILTASVRDPQAYSNVIKWDSTTPSLPSYSNPKWPEKHYSPIKSGLVRSIESDPSSQIPPEENGSFNCKLERRTPTSSSPYHARPSSNGNRTTTPDAEDQPRGCLSISAVAPATVQLQKSPLLGKEREKRCCSNEGLLVRVKDAASPKIGEEGQQSPAAEVARGGGTRGSFLQNRSISSDSAGSPRLSYCNGKTVEGETSSRSNEETPEKESGPIHPDLELSTTDSDTESVNSVSSRSEIVDEIDALMRGWNDAAGRKRVLDIVASLAKDFKQRKSSPVQSKFQPNEDFKIIPTEEYYEMLKEKSTLEEELKMFKEQVNKSLKIKSEPN